MKETSLVLMSRIKVYLLVVLMAFIMAALSSCGDDDDGDSTPMNPTLVEAAQSEGLTTLLDAVTAADLGSTLLGAEAITVFAPNNQAFENLLDGLTLPQYIARIGGVGNLAEVLGFHVVPGVIFSGDLAEGEQRPATLTAGEQQLTVIRSGNSVSVRDTEGNTYDVVEANIPIDNGVIHVIEGVLIPELTVPTVTEAVVADPNLSSLETAIGAVDGLGAILDGLESFTVFAPNDPAFTNLAQNAGAANVTELAGILGDDLSEVLTFHVIDEGVFFSDQLAEEPQFVTTLAGEQLTINRSGSTVTVTDTQGNNFTVTMADIAVEEGVVHVIDGVLQPSLPLSLTLQLNPDLSILREALEATDLDDVVASAGGNGLTIFAPDNDAFVGLLGLIGQQQLTDIPVGVLERVLLYHVVGGTVTSNDLTSMLSTSLARQDNAAEFEQLMIDTSDGVRINGEAGASVSDADNSATNGVVHIIDNVLAPPLEASIVNTIVEPAYFNVNFTTLTAAVTTAGLLPTLTGDTDYTLFAPDNAAFDALIADLPDISAPADLLVAEQRDRLIGILQYHVVNGRVFGNQLTREATTLNGDFYVSDNDNGVFINGSTQITAATLEGGDLVYDNGVVHLINRTLSPAADNVVQIAIAASGPGEGAEFGQLVAALTAVQNNTTSDILNVLQGDGPFTVFAPTDAAFQALYDQLPDSDSDGDNDLADLVAAVSGDYDRIATVLQYHVLGSRVFSTDIPNELDGNPSVTLTPLAGGTFILDQNLTIEATDGELSLGLPNANIILDNINILGTNGVIHAIDQVILP